MKSRVYFTRVEDGEDISFHVQKIIQLLDVAGCESVIRKNDMVAVKTSFGEKGNIGHLKPPIVRAVVDKVKECSGKPFLVETNTLYAGRRTNAVDHIIHAHEHGFNYENIGAPVIIGDGLFGEHDVQVEINQSLCKYAYVAGVARAANVIISLAHVTGHVMAGMGATLKNIGMGLSSRGGKLAQHSGVIPRILKKQCNTCGVCDTWCPAGAIKMGGYYANIDPGRCIGCGECLAVCQFGAVEIAWDENTVNLQKKVAEYCLAILEGKNGKAIFFNFLTHITKHCDCMDNPYEPDIPDIGIMASTDPVAIDKATVDIIKEHTGTDFFQDAWPGIDYTIQFHYAQEIGLGSTDYELIPIRRSLNGKSININR
ncbi:MAG: DUF362 domain-containing protein [wastewater metagenome]|nr:DUF362 domain-containing protein [Candidatus Loosdrechtia aerotolerans]